jgi:hypothetical protein
MVRGGWMPVFICMLSQDTEGKRSEFGKAMETQNNCLKLAYSVVVSMKAKIL